jgi:hypothetical protein
MSASQALPYSKFETDTVLPRPIVSSGEWDASKYVSSAVGGKSRKTMKKGAGSKNKKGWKGGRTSRKSKSWKGGRKSQKSSKK